MHNFELRCNKIKVEQLDVDISTIEEVVKDELTRIFDNITLEDSRALLKDVRILILPEWDIANAMIFDDVRREGQTRYRIEEDATQAHRGLKYIADHNALVLWPLQKENGSITQEKINKARSLMVYRVG